MANAMIHDIFSGTPNLTTTERAVSVVLGLGIAAAAHLSGLVDFVDLDGAMLLADDPYGGPTYEDGRIKLSDAPGLGVEPL